MFGLFREYSWRKLPSTRSLINCMKSNSTYLIITYWWAGTIADWKPTRCCAAMHIDKQLSDIRHNGRLWTDAVSDTKYALFYVSMSSFERHNFDPLSIILLQNRWHLSWSYVAHTSEKLTKCFSCAQQVCVTTPYPDSKVHEAYRGPTWGQKDPGGPHVGPMNLAIGVVISATAMGSLGQVNRWPRRFMKIMHWFETTNMYIDSWLSTLSDELIS